MTRRRSAKDPSPKDAALAERLSALRERVSRDLPGLAEQARADVVLFLAYHYPDEHFFLESQHGLQDAGSFLDLPHAVTTSGACRLARRVVRENAPLFAKNARREPVDSPLVRREGIVAAAALPLAPDQATNGREILGYLFFGYRHAKSFDRATCTRLRSMATALGDALAKLGAPALFRSQLSPTLEEPQATFRRILRLATTLINRPTAIWLYERQTRDYRIAASMGIPRDHVMDASALPQDGSLLGEVLASGRAEVRRDLATELDSAERTLWAREGWKSTLALPILERGKLCGAIQCFGYETDALGHQHFESLRRLAEMVGVALENSHLARESRGLTQLANRLAQDPDPGKAMRVIVDTARSLTEADSATIVISDPSEESFSIGAHAPRGRARKVMPRKRGGLTEQIIEDGNGVMIEDTESDPRVNPQLLKQKIRSLIGVRLQEGSERFGVLYVNSYQAQHFTDWDLRVVKSIADNASIALGWKWRLVEPWKRIEEAASGLVNLDGEVNGFSRRIKREFGFDYTALQLVRRDQNVIETIHGTGPALAWAGRSRHYLHTRPEYQDIQADIALARPLRAETLQGWDERFDRGVYDEFDHVRLSRLFVPLVLLRNRSGKIVTGWLDDYPWEQATTKCGTVCTFGPPAKGGSGELEIEVFGTLEAGFRNPEISIQPETLKDVLRRVIDRAPKIRRTMLRHVQETIVHEARKTMRADSASFHFRYQPNQERYLFEVREGLSTSFLTDFPPRPEGIGKAALRDGRPKVLDGKEFKTARPDLHREGIRAMAAFPLQAGEREGVLYLHFRRPHHFTTDELGWVELLSARAVDAIRHVTAYTEIQDRVRQLGTLSIVAQYLASNLEESDLLGKIAWNALNLLAADVVTIYEYIPGTRTFEFPPAMAGRLIDTTVMDSGIGKEDAPSLLAAEKHDIYVGVEEEVRAHEILNLPGRKRGHGRPPFVEREGVQASAGIRLEADGQLVGVMFINFRRPHFFDDHERHLIDALRSAAAIAIRNRALFKRRQEDLMLLAHDAQSPLWAMNGSLGSLRKIIDDLDRDLSEQALHRAFGEKLPKIHREIQRLDAYLGDEQAITYGLSLAYSREAGQSPRLDRELLLPAEEIQRAHEALREIDPQRCPSLEMPEADETIPPVQIDRLALRTVIRNLLQNAMKYADPGTPVEVSGERCRARRRSGVSEEFLDLKFSTQGAVIQPDEKESVFLKFYRAKATEEGKQKGRGVGFGLWASRQLMRIAGGDLRLDLDPERPRLSTFVVEIRLEEGDVSADGPHAAIDALEALDSREGAPELESSRRPPPEPVGS